MWGDSREVLGEARHVIQPAATRTMISLSAPHRRHGGHDSCAAQV
jgi:hypothetical protein